MVARRSACQGSTIVRCASWHLLVVNCSLLITAPIKNGTTGAIGCGQQFVHLQNVLYSKIFIDTGKNIGKAIGVVSPEALPPHLASGAGYARETNHAEVAGDMHSEKVVQVLFDQKGW